jgi:hypothetical protein
VREKTPNKRRRRTVRDEVNRDLAYTLLFLMLVGAAFLLIDYVLFDVLW